MRIRKMALWIVAICLASTVALEAQPGGRRGSSGGGMGGGVTPEQVFGLLAFDEKFKVNDKQLIALREVLKPLFVEQRQMMAEMFSSGRGGETDFRALREKMREQQAKMREKMMAALTTALSAEQVEALKAHMQQGQRQRGGSRGGGGPRGGGDGPQGGGF
ncbi:MAG: hypothetical protein OXI35_15000 [Gemmatimonadota bacterium]|nr:hypothetical protein [Gemmatimonadota bacterium]